MLYILLNHLKKQGGVPMGELFWLGSWLDGLAFVLAMMGVPLFVLECVLMWCQGQLSRERGKGMLTSLFCLVPSSLVQWLGTGALVTLYIGASWLVPWSIDANMLTALLCLVLVDFLYYWEHRLGHEVNLLWAMYHSVHHSARHYDQSIGVRISFVDFFFSPLFYLPLILLGFHPLLVGACLGLVLAWQQWIHTELIDRLPWCDGWLNTPSNHRVHHGSNPAYLDKNYGGILILWDRLFGTYAPEQEPVHYGLVEPLESHHPVDVHGHVFGKLISKLKQARSFPEAMRLLFRNPPF